MKPMIENHNGKYYVYYHDDLGNKYDTMRSFKTIEGAKKFVEEDTQCDQ